MSRDDDLKKLRARIITDDDVPPLVREFLEKGADLEEIRLDEHGNWWHEGEIFENPRLSLLFHRSLTQTGSGNWVLEIKPYTYPVLVDLCGTFVARIIDTDGSRASVRLRDESTTEIALDKLYTDGDKIIATQVDGKPARLVDTAYRQITGTIDTDGERYVFEYDGHQYDFAELPDGFFPDAD